MIENIIMAILTLLLGEVLLLTLALLKRGVASS
jgi:hypothetical protein